MAPKLLEKEQNKIAQNTREYDKRYFPRWEVNKRVEYREEGAGTASRSYTKDLSLDGVSIYIFGNPPTQQRLQLRIHLADKDNFEAQGRVAWSKVEPTYKLFGVVFENLIPKAQDLIMRHAFELSEDQLFIYKLSKKVDF